MTKKAAAGGKVVLKLQLSGTQPACTFAVSSNTVVVRLTSGIDRIWSSQDCPGSVPRRDVVVRNAVPTTIDVSWSGRRSDSTCSGSTAWALPGYYHAETAALGSTPANSQFRLSLPTRPVVTKTAHLKAHPTKTPAKKAAAKKTQATPTSSPTR